MHPFLAFLAGLVAGLVVMYFLRAKAVSTAKQFEQLAEVKLSAAEVKAQVFKVRLRSELDKIEGVPAHALASLKNLVHGTAQRAENVKKAAEGK